MKPMVTSTPTLFVTGATGQLGRLVIDALLETVPASTIVAGVGEPTKEVAIAMRGSRSEPPRAFRADALAGCCRSR